MKKITALVLVGLMSLSGCDSTKVKEGFNEDGTYTGKGAVETKSYDLKDFDSFNIFNDIDVTVTKGDKFSVEVTTNKDVFDKLSITTSGDVLSAKNKKDIVLKDTVVTMKVICPEVEDVKLHNDSDMIMKEEFETGSTFSVHLQNDSSLKGTIKSEGLDATVNNDTKLTLEGSTKDITLIGTSDTVSDLSKLLGESALINLKSDAKCSINVKGDIQLTTKSSPTINVYSGTIVKNEVSEDTIINQK